MAELKSDFLGGEPQITSFEFDENILKGDGEFSVRIFTDYSKEWADFIFANRNNPTDKNIHPYDIVYGPIYNPQIEKFEKYKTTRSDFYKFNKTKRSVCNKTQASFKCLLKLFERRFFLV